MSASAESASVVEEQRQAARWRLLILGVLFVALVLRLVAAVLVERHVQSEGRTYFVEGDANGYWDLGTDIAARREYSVHEPPRRILRVPGFPLLLAASIRVFGASIFAARCVLAVVGVGCCWLTWLLGSRLVMRRVGFWAALLMAIHPLQVVNSVLILSENWFTFWMLAGLLMLVKLVDGPAGLANDKQTMAGMLFRAAMVGALIALAVLVRPGFAPWLLVAVGAVVVLMKLEWTARSIIAGTMVGAFLMIMAPWTIRNHQVSGHWVVTSLWSGPSLYDGLNPDANGASNMQFFDRDDVMETMSEYEMNQHYQRLAWRYAIDHPVRTCELAGRKLLKYLQLVPTAVEGGWVLWVLCAVLAAGAIVLCLVGFRSGLVDPIGLVVTTGPFLLFLAVHMVFVGSLRYRLPAEFPLAILAATGLRQWLPGKRQL